MHIRVSMILTVLLALSAPNVHAQTITTGLKVGIDFSSMPNFGAIVDQIVKQPSTETSSKVGALFGGFVTVPLWNRIAVQPELQFVMKGAKVKEAGNAGTVNASVRYLEFPVLLRYGLPVGEHTGYVLVGPTFGVKAGTSAQLDGPSQTADVEIDPALRTFDAGLAVQTHTAGFGSAPAIRTFDAGLAFAGGCDYRRYFAELRYTQGLTDVAA